MDRVVEKEEIKAEALALVAFAYVQNAGINCRISKVLSAQPLNVLIADTR